MRSRRAWVASRWCFVCLPVLCGLSSLARAAGPEVWTPPDELLTAQHLSKQLTNNQWYAAGAGVVALALLLVIAYLVPLIRAPRWQVLGFALAPMVVAFATMFALSRPIEPKLTKIPYEEMRKVTDSEVATTGEKALADKVVKWQGEIEGRSFLIDVSTMPMSAAFGAAALIVAALWFLSHRNVLRTS
jgi:hypothetical protein